MDKQMRCIAIDDEPLALAQMTTYIERTQFLDLVGTFRSALDALPWIECHPVDLIFVDINMPDLNGLDFVRMNRENIPQIILTTAYPQYALEGYKVDATDYLLKPIGYEDFLRSSQKAFRNYNAIDKHIKYPQRGSTLFVKYEYKSIPIELSEICFIESQSEYVKIYTDSKPPIMTLGSLVSYEKKLDANLFVRVHRAFIINISKIEQIDRKNIVVAGHSIPIGDIYRDNIKSVIAFLSIK